jgi:hypothetical protein
MAAATGDRGHLLAPESALALAALRLVVPALLLLMAGGDATTRLAALPRAVMQPPEGLAWFAAHAPISPHVVLVFRALLAFGALLALVGVHARAGLALATVAGLYLFAIPQLFGTVTHGMHLLWLAALLAASPCDHALAWDARGKPPPADSRIYAAPLVAARGLLACVYFFPGAHKLARSGLAWALSDNLRHQLWWKWAQHGVVPALRVDRVPGLLEAGGVFVLAFELSFPLLVLSRRTQPWAAALGLLFHASAELIFRIPFPSLWACYVVLVDPRALFRWLGRAPVRAQVDESARPWRSTAIAGAVLVACAAVQGARGQMQAYPFACYPTFEWIAGAEMPDLRIVATRDDGTEREVVHGRDASGRRDQRTWGEVWSLAGVTAPVREERLRGYYMQNARDAAARDVRVRFERVWIPVDPDLPSRAPVRVEPLLEISVTR